MKKIFYCIYFVFLSRKRLFINIKMNIEIEEKIEEIKMNIK